MGETNTITVDRKAILILAAASAVAVVVLNSLAFGVSVERVADSVAHTFFIASSVLLFVVFAAPLIEGERLVVRFALMVVGIAIATYFGILLTRFVIGFFNPLYSWLPGTRTVIFSLIISYIFGFGGYIYLNSKHRLNRAKALVIEKAEAEKRAKTLATEARLASLESRIHPHFLFNTLNSIAALIRDEPAVAERMVEQLSNILRHSLDTGIEHLTTIDDELSVTKDYLDIQKTRFSESLDINFNVDSALGDFQVPTFSIHTLVENSIKHVASNSKAKTSIGISVNKNNDLIVVEVTDSGDGFGEELIEKGHGLENLRSRMSAIYGDAAELKVNRSNSSVALIFPKS